MTGFKRIKMHDQIAKDTKECLIGFYKDFIKYSERKTIIAGNTRNGTSGKARSYGNALIYLICNYTLMTGETIKAYKVTSPIYAKKLLAMSDWPGFDEYNRTENHFPSAALREYKDYVDFKHNLSLTEYTSDDLLDLVTLDDNKLITIHDIPTIETPEESQEQSECINRQDYFKQAKLNKEIGNKGEKLITKYEEKRLLKDPRLSKYAKDILVYSLDKKDSVGYDIRSFELNNKDKVQERYIEVKSTNQGIKTPFYLSNHQVQVRANLGEQYYIYRLFDIKKTPGLYILGNESNYKLHMIPTNYLVYPESK